MEKALLAAGCRACHSKHESCTNSCPRCILDFSTCDHFKGPEQKDFIALRKPVMGTFWDGRSFWKGRKTLCAIAEQPLLHPEVELSQNKAGTQRYDAWQELLVAHFGQSHRLVKPPFSSSQAPSPAAACVVKSCGRTFPVHSPR